MIVTITLNPCIDKSTSVPEIKPEAKLRNTEVINEPGGGGINVSKALAKLGIDSSALFPSGGHNGDMLKNLLKAEKIPFHSIDSKVETRENWIVGEANTGKQFRFTFPGREVEEGAIKEMLEELQSFAPSFVVASGSMPPGLPDNFYGLVVKYACAAGAKCIVDTSGEALKGLKGKGAYLIKPNISELCKLLGIEKLDLLEVDDAAQQLIQNGYAELVAVSMGGDGAWLVSADEKHFTPAPKVEVKTTVGAGDSMVAGITYMLYKNEPLQNAIRFGVCCGSGATMNAGTELFKVEDVWRLYHAMQ
ncbi:MAG: 1-phosphofructokinase family hexose kinase [Bacteroidota bacterium]